MAGHSEQRVMPVIRDLKDFDFGSGSVLERIIFNNRIVVLLACLVATLVLGFAATRIQVNRLLI